MEDALRQLRVHATTAQMSMRSTLYSSHLLRELSYHDLIDFAHEVGSALVEAPEGSMKRHKLRDMYQRVANEHAVRLNKLCQTNYSMCVIWTST